MIEGWAFCDYIWAYFLFFLLAGSIAGHFIADFATRNFDERILEVFVSVAITLTIWGIEFFILLNVLDTRCT